MPFWIVNALVGFTPGAIVTAVAPGLLNCTLLTVTSVSSVVLIGRLTPVALKMTSLAAPGVVFWSAPPESTQFVIPPAPTSDQLDGLLVTPPFQYNVPT